MRLKWSFIIAILFSIYEVGAEQVIPLHPLYVSSSDGSFLVKVRKTQGKDVAEAVFYRAGKDDSLSVEKIFELTNRDMPKNVFISNSGNIVTLDDWNSYGRGENVIVVYDYNGQIIRRYSLRELYSQTDLNKFLISSSSIHWRCIEIEVKVYLGKKLVIYDRIGGEIVIDMDSAELEYKKNSDMICPKFP